MGLKPVSVSQLNSYIKRILQTDPILGNVSVTGELSNVKYHSTGHVYFSLKDEKSTIRCFLPAGNADNIAFRLEDGLEVNVYGYLYLYEKGGYYSINVKDIEESGEGRLMAEFRALKRKLEGEGLFDQEHKKPLPSFPSQIAVVTSATGAAVRDIIKIIKNKNDYVNVLIYPVTVQGPSAAGEIAEAIDDINRRFTDIDVIITGRGGGSIEELWAFNEEKVARSIYKSSIPVISAVGHETDFTIADFVADRRAETPTAAADMAVPDTTELRDYINNLDKELSRSIRIRIQQAENSLNLMNPELFMRQLKSRTVMAQMKCDGIYQQLNSQVDNKLTDFTKRVELAGQVINSSNPDLILARGYAIVRNSQVKIVKNASEVSIGDTIDISLAEGKARATVIDEKEKR